MRNHGLQLSMKPWLLIILFPLVLTPISCHTPAGSEQTATTLTPGQRKPGAKKIMLIETPRNVREDVRYPESSQMGFYWSDNVAEWHFKLASGHYGHAGFRFWFSQNLADERARYELIFKISPAHMANHLWVGLIDGEDNPDRVLVDLPLARYAPNAKGRSSIEIRIPLSDFPDLGPVLYDGRISSNGSPHEAVFDWADVSEIRMIHNGGRLPNREVTITGMRFQR